MWGWHVATRGEEAKAALFLLPVLLSRFPAFSLIACVRSRLCLPPPPPATFSSPRRRRRAIIFCVADSIRVLPYWLPLYCTHLASHVSVNLFYSLLSYSYWLIDRAASQLRQRAKVHLLEQNEWIFLLLPALCLPTPLWVTSRLPLDSGKSRERISSICRAAQWLLLQIWLID